MGYLHSRHEALAKAMAPYTVLLSSGFPQCRNYPDNTYPFRPASHFLYLAGWSAPGSYFLLHNGQAHLFLPPYTIDDVVWSGPGESTQEAARRSECTVHCTDELADFLHTQGVRPESICALPLPCEAQNESFEPLLGRSPSLGHELDRKLALALVELRLHADEQAQAELRVACELTVMAHLEGLKALKAPKEGKTEYDIAQAMLKVVNGCGGYVSFNPIISTSGERLHQIKLGAALVPDRLLLVDFGAESSSGWAGDITNTWPVSGRFSQRQAQIYNLVLEAHRSCVEALAIGVDYAQVHRRAVEVFAEGLDKLGILHGGTIEEYLNSNVVSLFFPHGVGHLMGLDVHDMEDLGDLAGYAPGRERSTLFGWKSLRLNRNLEAGMVVTIEPGLYFIPELFQAPQFMETVDKYVDMQIVGPYFEEVHGVRIERDYMVSETGSVLLTPDMPTTIEEIEQFMARA
ncbi:MAG: aminopeptidase P N-terminal domain-containing protein [bacterium]|nr:aminopeptidase P N-terminal domain-containing protein [bacterium]